ncbi:hypothetical protein AVEN_87354-1 [Araneus ventricosus]|uniref:Uncharacterized protein n=1 Tax=Araneus ventricosus TaxID=182803 RepID=A0A4Y2MGN9_ARAVE|nr:hypothetical protein AVEN_87354-1 [Araneus ventricosus]
MASGHALGIPPHQLTEWNENGSCRPPSNEHEVCLDPYFSHCLFRIGIYGWRKRCLYFLIILLCSLVVINLSLTVWIIKVLDFTMVSSEFAFLSRSASRYNLKTGHSLSLHAILLRTVMHNHFTPFHLGRSFTITPRHANCATIIPYHSI